MLPVQFFENLRQLIAGDELDAALQQLRSLLDNSPHLDEALHHAGRWNDIRRQVRLGTVSHEDATLTKNQIRCGLLDFITEIEGIMSASDGAASSHPATAALRAEVERAISIAHSENIVAAPINAGTVHVGNEIHHYYGERRIPHALTPPPFLSEYFIGREDDLRAIHDKLFAPGGHHILLVNGEGGVGKTSVAARYFHNYRHEYEHVAWVLSEGSIAAALLRLAIPLGLSFDERMDNDERLGLLLTALANLRKPCLLVVDNANELPDLAAHYPRLQACTNFHVLLTTRIGELPGGEFYKIRPLPQDLALQAFRRHYRAFNATEEPLFCQLYDNVGGNTLVLEVLAKNLDHFNNRLRQRYRLADLVADVERSLLRLSQSAEVDIRYQSRTGLRHATPEAVIAAMYDLTALPPEESALLSVLAVLPAERIPFTQLEALLQADDLDRHLLALAQKGWVDYEEADASFKCSPVVQEVVKHQNPRLSEDCRPLLDGLNKSLARDVIHLDNYQQAATFARYGESVLLALPAPDWRLNVLCDRMGYYYQQVGDLGRALSVYERQLLLVEKLLEGEPENENLKNSLATTTSWLGTVHSALGNLQQALTFFEEYFRLSKELHEAFPQNVGFKNELAVSYSKLGSTHSALGNLQQALTFFEEFFRLSKELHEAFPQNEEFKNVLAVSYQFLGETHTALGNLQQALTFFEEFFRLSKELHEAFPQNVGFKNGLAISYEKLGVTHSALGNLQQALTFFEELNRLEKELHEAFPQNVGFKNGLAISYEKLGVTHSALGNLQQALTFFEEFFRLSKELHEAFPENVEFKNVLAISYQFLGQTHTALGNLQQALTFFEEETRLLKELHTAFPQNVGFKNGLAVSYSKLGSTHSELGNLQQALTFFEEYFHLSKELHEAFPENVEFKNVLAISYQFLGQTHTALGNLQQALTFFEEETRLLKELHTAFPQNVGFKNGLAVSYSKLGSTHSELGNLQQALTFFEEYFHLSKELHEAFPQKVEFKKGLAVSYSKVGETHFALGNLQQALTFFEELNRLEKELHEAFPQNVEFKNGLAVSYSKVGETHSALGNLQQALTFFEEFFRLSKELHEAFPENVGFKNVLAVSYEKLGVTHSALDNLQQALTFFEEYFRLSKELHEAFPENVGFKKGLAISYSKLGETHSALGNLQQALTFFEEFFRLSKELHEAFPENVGFKNVLAVSYAKLAQHHRDHLEDKGKAKAYFQKAAQLWEELVRAAPQYLQFQHFLGMVRQELEDLD